MSEGAANEFRREACLFFLSGLDACEIEDFIAQCQDEYKSAEQWVAVSIVIRKMVEQKAKEAAGLVH